MSQLPASAVRTLRPQSSRSATQRVSAAPAVSVPGPVVVPPPAPPAPPEPPKTHDLDVIGPRKLIRPVLPERMLRERRLPHYEEPALVSHATAPAPPHHDVSHAESFYFQKQVQAQTPMVFVLEDGERVEGCIEWYDRNAVKVRCSGSSFRGANGRSQGLTRVLIYKSAIKYLYKSGENSSQL
jgi:hypothetical protein